MHTNPFSSITHYLVHFTNDDLHRLASDSIESDPLLNTNSGNLLVLDALNALRHASVDILLDACTRTTKDYCIMTLVENISYSWKDPNGDILCIRNNKKFEECLHLAVSAQTLKFVLHAHCDLHYFATTFDGLNLDDINTVPFPVIPIPVPTGIPPSHCSLPCPEHHTPDQYLQLSHSSF
jgi:hypothetical protein